MPKNRLESPERFAKAPKKNKFEGVPGSARPTIHEELKWLEHLPSSLQVLRERMMVTLDKIREAETRGVKLDEKTMLILRRFGKGGEYSSKIAEMNRELYRLSESFNEQGIPWTAAERKIREQDAKETEEDLKEKGY